MLVRSIAEYRARILLNFSDLCCTDAQVAACLNYLPIPSPSGIAWNADQVRASMPEAIALATNYSLKTYEHCKAIHAAVCSHDGN